MKKFPKIYFIISIIAIAIAAIFIMRAILTISEDKSRSQIALIEKQIEEKIKDISSGKEQTSGKIFYVSPDGNDDADGFSRDNPIKTIQKAIDRAGPGDLVNLADGVYFQDFMTKKNGEKDMPITIKGKRDAIIKGAGNPRVVEINHNHIILEGFTVDGLHGFPDEPDGFRSKLIYVLGREDQKGVTGLVIRKMSIRNAGGECIRFRYFAQKNEIADNVIENCGTYDFKFDGGGKNGEGIYIGTAPEQQNDGKNPNDGADNSNDNWIHNNRIDTQGNECVDIKEGSSGNIVEKNKCTGQKDSKSGGLDARGNDNVFRNNEVFENEGAGIRFGGDSKKYGIENIAYGNIIRNNKSGGIKLEQEPQKMICGNTFKGNGIGKYVGEYGRDSKADEICR